MTLTEFSSTDKAITSVVAHSDAGHCKIRQVRKLRTRLFNGLELSPYAVQIFNLWQVVRATAYLSMRRVRDSAMDVQKLVNFHSSETRRMGENLRDFCLIRGQTSLASLYSRMSA